MENLIPTILNIAFLVVAGLVSLAAVLGVYIYIRYGTVRSITVFSSLVFIVIYLMLIGSAYATLQAVIEFYA